MTQEKKERTDHEDIRRLGEQRLSEQKGCESPQREEEEVRERHGSTEKGGRGRIRRENPERVVQERK